MKYSWYISELVSESEMKDNPMFWNYFFHYAFRQKHRPDISQKIIDYVSQHGPLDEAWAEEFARPKKDSEERKAPKENYVRAISYFPKGISYHIYIRFYKDKILYNETDNIEDAKKESVSRMSLKTYKKILDTCGVLQSFLLIPMVYVKKEEMTEFQALVRTGLLETTVPSEDHDTLKRLIMAYCEADEKELEGDHISRIFRIWSAGAFILIAATLLFVSRHNYRYIGEEGLYRQVVDSFSYIPAYLYILGSVYGAVLYFMFFARAKNEKRKKVTSKKLLIAGICTFLFLYPLGTFVYHGALAVMDIQNLERQLAEMDVEVYKYGRIKPWTWEGLEKITLEDPKVHFSRGNGRNKGKRHVYISASNIDKHFDLPGNVSNAEHLQKLIDNGETIVVYYYRHSRVVERICNGKDNRIMG